MSSNHTFLSRIISYEYEHIKVSQSLCELLYFCKASVTTRYAINKVSLADGEIAVTDRRKLLAIKLPDGFECKQGIYHLAADGFLLGPISDAGTFPKYEDIIPKIRVELIKFNIGCESDTDCHQNISRAIKKVCEAGHLLNFFWFTSVILRMVRCGFCEFAVYAGGDSKNQPITVEANGAKGAGVLRYIQMQINSDDDNA